MGALICSERIWAALEMLPSRYTRRKDKALNAYLVNDTQTQTGRFMMQIRSLKGTKVDIIVQLFCDLKGTSNAQNKARQYLLEIGHRKSYSAIYNEDTGFFELKATVNCDIVIENLSYFLTQQINTLQTELDKNYDCWVTELEKLGVQVEGCL